MFKAVNKLPLLLFTILIILSLLKPLTSYFSQDDFFQFREIMNANLFDARSLLSFRYSSDQTFYRPLSREILNTITFHQFGLNAWPYHFLNLALIILNGLIFMFLIEQFTKNKIIPQLFFIIYLMSAVHSVEIYYLSSVQTLSATFFMVSCLVIFYKFLESRRVILLISSFFLFGLALLSHESSIVLLPILVLLAFFKNTFKEIKKDIISLLPFAFLLIIRVIIQLKFVNLPHQLVYQPVFSPKSILNSLIWFILWCVGVIEWIPDFIGKGLSLNQNLLRYYSTYIWIMMACLLAFWSSIIVLFIFYKKSYSLMSLVFLITSFLISLTPFLIYPLHKFIYYLSFSILWFSAILAVILARTFNKNFLTKLSVVVVLLAMLVLDFQTSSLNELSYWAAKRDKAAAVLLSNIIKQYPIVSKGSTFFIENDPNYPFISENWGNSSQQAKLIMSGSDALQLLYHDSSIKVYFEGPDNPSYKKVIATFPY